MTGHELTVANSLNFLYSFGNIGFSMRVELYGMEKIFPFFFSYYTGHRNEWRACRFKTVNYILLLVNNDGCT